MAVAHSAGRLQEHFVYLHFQSKVAVVQEGEDQFPYCDFCVMHTPLGRLIKHQRTAQCDKNTQIRWRRWDVEITDKYLEDTFSLTSEDAVECIDGLEVFKYLGRLL